MDDTEQMIVNELRRIDRAIDRRAKALQDAANKEGMRTFPKRYVVDLPVDTPTSAAYTPGDQLSSAVRSFVVDRDCKRFFCQQITASLLMRGAVGVFPATITPPTLSTDSTPLVFLWQVRDTSSDREWSDQPLHSYALPINSLIDSYMLPTPAVLDPGTEVQVDIKPLYALSTVEQLNNINRISVLFSFIGFEVL